MSVNGLLGCVHVLAIIDSAAVYSGVRTSFWIRGFFFLDVYPGVGLLDYVVAVFYVFMKIPYCFPWWLPQITFPPTVYKYFLFSILSPAFIVGILFGDGHSDLREMILHCGFALHFSNN